MYDDGLSLALRLWDQVELWRGGAESERVGGDGWPRRLRHELDFFFLTRGRRELGVPVFSFLFFFCFFRKPGPRDLGPWAVTSCLLPVWTLDFDHGRKLLIEEVHPENKNLKWTPWRGRMKTEWAAMTLLRIAMREGDDCRIWG
jgi:hypothetical protein